MTFQNHAMYTQGVGLAQAPMTTPEDLEKLKKAHQEWEASERAKEIEQAVHYVKVWNTLVKEGLPGEFALTAANKILFGPQYRD